MQNKVLPIFIIAVLTFSCIYFLNRKDQPSMPRAMIEKEVTSSQFPVAIGFVNDFENLIEKTKEILFTRLIQTHESETSNQIAIVTLDTLGEYTDFNQYTLDLANHWGVGQKDKNNGILFAISKKLRKLRVEVGDGLAKQLSNEETKDIIDQFAIPNFKQGNYSRGIELCLREIIKKLK